MWVIYATKAMLNADLSEEKEEANTNSINNNVSPSQVPNIQSQIAGLRRTVMLLIIRRLQKRKLDLVHLKNDANSHTIFIQASGENIYSSWIKSIAAVVVKALG